MKDLEYFKNRLLSLKHQHSKRIQSIDKDIRHTGMSADWAEQATERENDEVLESLGIASKDELQQVNAALHRIDAGEYFYCSQCGEEIPAARLELLPFTTTCVKCAELKEN
jgi:DnaK suppressor protein